MLSCTKVVCAVSLAAIGLLGVCNIQYHFTAYDGLNPSQLCDQNRNLSLSPPAPYTLVTVFDHPAMKTNPFLESKSFYARVNGYCFQPFSARLASTRAPAWSKVLALERIMQQQKTAEWIWLLDYDTLVFSFGQKLEHIVAKIQERRTLTANMPADLIISSDHNGLNAGSMLIRNNAWAQDLVRRWWHNNNQNISRIAEFFEQAALRDLIERDINISAKVEILYDQNSCLINCYAHTKFREGHLVAHFPGSTKQYMGMYARLWQNMMRDCRLRHSWLNSGNSEARC